MNPLSVHSQTEINRKDLRIDTNQANQPNKIVIVASPKEGGKESPFN